MAGSYLLDTHALIWWAGDQRRLSRAAFDVIEDGANELFVSAVSAMEIATKVRIGRLEAARPLATNLRRQLADHGFRELPLQVDHGELAGSFPSSHNDPWDRLLAAQSIIEGLPLITHDRQMDGFGAKTFW